MSRVKTVELWSERWERLYAREAVLLSDVLQAELVAIDHVGSTSVQAIGYAKPIIDVLIRVVDIERLSQYDGQMTALHYRVRGENGIAGRRYYSKGESPRTHHVHVFQQDDPRVFDYLDFKAYMLAHPDEAAQYGQLKLEIMAHNGQENYQQLKEQRMAHWVVQARKWGFVNRNPV